VTGRTVTIRGTSMNKKQQRQDAIRALLAHRGGSTQEHIRTTLNERGIKASQATLSRDLRELGAAKVPGADGNSVYRQGANGGVGFPQGHMLSAMTEFGAGMEKVGNLLIIGTTPGRARDLCLVLDTQKWPEVAGTIAGDDTILVIGRSAAGIRTVAERLRGREGKERA
jgi:transcriptional regulator of arginine metabolism